MNYVICQSTLPDDLVLNNVEDCADPLTRRNATTETLVVCGLRGRVRSPVQVLWIAVLVAY